MSLQFHMQNLSISPTFKFNNLKYIMKNNKTIQIQEMLGISLFMIAIFIAWAKILNKENIYFNIIVFCIMIFLVIQSIIICFNVLVINLYTTAIFSILSVIFLTDLISHQIQIILLIMACTTLIILLRLTGTSIQELIYASHNKYYYT